MSKPTDVLDELFEGLDSTPAPFKPSASNTTSSKPTAPGTPTNTPNAASTSKPTNLPEKDILAEFDLLTADRRPPSRPSTPRTTALGKSFDGRREAGKVGGGYGIGTAGSTPMVRKDSNDVKVHTPSETPPPPPSAVPLPTFAVAPASARTEAYNGGGGFGGGGLAGGGGAGGGWLGSLWGTASAAMKTAENVYKEVQTQATLAAGSATTQSLGGTVQKLSSEIRTRALPTLSNLLHTIAPPISSHEQLRIHITHDIAGYPSIDAIVYGVFDRVMQQVEGGDLLVVQKGRESKPRSSALGGVVGGGGWGGGPWFRSQEPRALNACFGEGAGEEGVKLARAAAESYAGEYMAVQQQQFEYEDQSGNLDNPTRKSDIFLAIQPTTYPAPKYLAPQGADDEGKEENLTAFALHLLDPTHGIAFSTVSQALPATWLQWIDDPNVPEDVREVVDAGGVDPREWVAEWVEETLGLAVGVVAQRYVARRMNVRDGGVDGRKGKGRERTSGVGEEARVGLL